jgi:SNF2 family DNA or RNA helicase
LSTREKRLKSFRERDTSVIFLNSTFNGAGINLQEATDIILYHEMSTDTQNQILGRANRIGRQKPLQVHHLQVRI